MKFILVGKFHYFGSRTLIPLETSVFVQVFVQFVLTLVVAVGLSLCYRNPLCFRFLLKELRRAQARVDKRC